MKTTRALKMAALALLTVSALAAAEGGEKAKAPAKKKSGLQAAIAQVAAENEASAEAQKKIDETSDQTDALLDEFRATRRRIEAIGKYNEQLQELLDAQQEEIASLERQLTDYALIARQITPLMLRMLDTLEDFVALDVPFLLEERKERLAGLRKLMKRADVEDSEKFRKLMEAYQVENEYGRTIEAYRGKLKLDGQEQTVDFLRVGRVVLLYRTLDGQQVGRYDAGKRSWEALPREYLSSIPRALRIARKQAAPNMMRLPVAAPETVK